ncbi:hypothetical protein CDAR_383261 [Caerostris darwini]|uniref:Uncharacterized protein n=1 Tax=Caerostris darwini TaxID=1538125 RepID=A0AAV4NZ80_9ARAC|nr:hypothetical protein CDAR_383261 [Caerostris darwini]
MLEARGSILSTPTPSVCVSRYPEYTSATHRSLFVLEQILYRSHVRDPERQERNRNRRRRRRIQKSSGKPSRISFSTKRKWNRCCFSESRVPRVWIPAETEKSFPSVVQWWSGPGVGHARLARFSMLACTWVGMFSKANQRRM